MELKFSGVISVSSEDPCHPADALLRNEKWLCAPGSKHTHIEVVLQLSEASSIASIHIGNFGSAFISVLVAKTGSLTFTSLLPQSIFMSVLDCKLSKNKTQVRMFSQSDLLPVVRDDKWSQVKVRCSQPFNMFMQYGVSFVRVFSTSEVHLEGKETSPSSWQAFKRLSQPTATNRMNHNTGGLLSRSERLLLQSAKPLTLHSNKDCHKSPQRSMCLSPEDKMVVSKEENHDQEENEDEDVFRAKALSFLETLELHKKSLQNIELGHVTREFEAALGRQLTMETKRNFTEILRTYLKSLKELQFEKQSSSPKHIPSNNTVQCKSLVSQQRGSEEAGNTPRKVVVKSCSPGWLRNLGQTGASVQDVEVHEGDSPVSPVRCSSSRSNIRTGGEGPSSHSEVAELNPAMRRNNVSLEGVDSDAVISPRRSKLPSLSEGTLKRLLPSSNLTTGNSPKKSCESVTTGECVFVSSVTRNIPPGDILVQCPICTKYFDTSEVQSHAESCESFIEPDSDTNTLSCPLCSKKVNKDEVLSHADSCARTMFGD